jgi:uncharacterized RDD family membrane protein YckC
LDRRYPCFLGALGLISSVLNIGNLGLYWMIALVVVEFVVGFLLGYGLIQNTFWKVTKQPKKKVMHYE